MPQKTAQDDVYDFADDVPRRAIQSPAPARSDSAKPAPLHYRSRKPASAAPVDSDKIRNLQMPLWLLGAGVGIEMVALFLRGDGVEAGLVDLAANLILGTMVMLAGIFLAARLRQIDLGNFWTAAFKLAAIVVAPSAAIDLVTPVLNIIPLGGLVGLAIDFILYFALLGALFELNESDTWYCVWVIFLVRLAVFFAMVGIQAKWG